MQSVTSRKLYTQFTKRRRAVLKIPSLGPLLSCLSSLLFTLHVWLCRGQREQGQKELAHRPLTGIWGEMTSPQWERLTGDRTTSACWREKYIFHWYFLISGWKYSDNQKLIICSSIIIPVKFMSQWKFILNLNFETLQVFHLTSFYAVWTNSILQCPFSYSVTRGYSSILHISRTYHECSINPTLHLLSAS